MYGGYEYNRGGDVLYHWVMMIVGILFVVLIMWLLVSFVKKQVKSGSSFTSSSWSPSLLYN
jgi:flagellar biogenesis protein FliO